MATTTAQIQLSSDLLSNPINISTSTTCMKASGGEGLDMVRMGNVDIATGTNFDLFNADNASNVNKANKVYVCNNSTDESYYVVITIDATVIGRLYANDWMFIPWGAEDATADIEIQAYTGTNKINYMLFHEGETLLS